MKFSLYYIYLIGGHYYHQVGPVLRRTLGLVVNCLHARLFYLSGLPMVGMVNSGIG